MTRHTAINAAIFTGILAAMVGIQAIDDHSQEHQVAKEELAKQRQQDRIAKAAREVCGENAGFSITEGKNEIVCKTKRGHKTGKVASL